MNWVKRQASFLDQIYVCIRWKCLCSGQYNVDEIYFTVLQSAKFKKDFYQYKCDRYKNSIRSKIDPIIISAKFMWFKNSIKKMSEKKSEKQ